VNPTSSYKSLRRLKDRAAKGQPIKPEETTSSGWRINQEHIVANLALVVATIIAMIALISVFLVAKGSFSTSLGILSSSSLPVIFTAFVVLGVPTVSFFGLVALIKFVVANHESGKAIRAGFLWFAFLFIVMFFAAPWWMLLATVWLFVSVATYVATLRRAAQHKKTQLGGATAAGATSTGRKKIGRWIRWLVELPARLYNPIDPVTPHALIIENLMWLVFIIIFLTLRPWMPAEQLTINGAVSVGYVLSSDSEWTAYLTEDTRMVKYVETDEVESRILCIVDKGDDSIRSFAVLISGGQRVRYPECPKP
jgi:hypothetical protein